MKVIPFSPPDITDLEINEVIDALKSGWITTGERTRRFEQKLGEYLNNKNVVAFSSCTWAMELMLKLYGVKSGDEVITTAYTYTASASVAYHLGAKIVLVDTLENSFLMNPCELEKAITPKTKVVIPVDIAGKMCDYDAIFKIVENKKDLFSIDESNELQKVFKRPIVLADSAHAFGATQKGKKSGLVADFTAFSFHAVKNLTTGEGGAITWKDKNGIDNEELSKMFKAMSLHGQTKDAFAKNQPGLWEYDIIYPAYKCNMTDIHAAIGIKQLERYDSLLEKRKQVVKMYDDAFLQMGLDPLRHFGEDFTTSYHLYMLKIPQYNQDDRNEFIKRLAEKGIVANVHYKPLPMLTAYKNLGFNIDEYPNAFKQYSQEVSLPLHTLLSEEDVKYVIDAVKSEI